MGTLGRWKVARQLKVGEAITVNGYLKRIRSINTVADSKGHRTSGEFSGGERFSYSSLHKVWCPESPQSWLVNHVINRKRRKQ